MDLYHWLGNSDKDNFFILFLILTFFLQRILFQGPNCPMGLRGQVILTKSRLSKSFFDNRLAQTAHCHEARFDLPISTFPNLGASILLAVWKLSTLKLLRSRFAPPKKVLYGLHAYFPCVGLSGKVWVAIILLLGIGIHKELSNSYGEGIDEKIEFMAQPYNKKVLKQSWLNSMLMV